MSEKLAIFGGTPVRTKPWLVEPMTDEDEERMVLGAMREKSYSRYIGAAAPNLEQILRLTSEEAARIADYWHFLGGTNVRAFAAEFAQAMGSTYAIPVNAATTGLSVALAAAGVGPGDEVIVPAVSYTATASAVLLFNSIPVFADVDPDSFCIDPVAVERAITRRTRAIMPVHLTGNVADMDAILAIARRHNLVVIEDAAQAIGASWNGRKAGTLGNAGVFSFQQSKNIMTGEGGMIVTDDPEIARRCRLIINHGEVAFDDRHSAEDLANIVGCNFRMPELCAAVGRAQLRKLDTVNAWRTRNADVLQSELAELPGLRLPPSQRQGNGPGRDVPHLFVALYDSAEMGASRAAFVAALRAEGVPVGTGYTRPMYANPTFLRKIAFGSKGCPWTCQGGAGVEYRHGLCPVGERLLNEEFLWFYHIAYASTEDDMREIGRAVRKVVTHRADLTDMPQEVAHSLGAKAQGRIGTGPARSGA
jgi:dTDP-4-amino-4,6-dideoxygalactose transaminase